MKNKQSQDNSTCKNTGQKVNSTNQKRQYTRTTQAKKERQAHDDIQENGLKNLFAIIKRYAPTIADMFSSEKAQKADHRRRGGNFLYNTCYLLMMVMLMHLLSYSSMHSFQVGVNGQTAMQNLHHIVGEEVAVRSVSVETTLYGQTLNNFLSQFDASFLDEVLWSIIRKLIRCKTFYPHRLLKHYWLIAIDGTQTYSGKRKLNAHCLFRTHKKGTDQESTEYYLYILQAKLVLLGTEYCIPFFHEFVENNAIDKADQQKKGAQSIKQDCEIKAFKRLAQRIRRTFPNLPICIVADALYVTNPVIDICKDHKFELIVRYKEGAYKEIKELFECARKSGGATRLADTDETRDVIYANKLELAGSRFISYIEATMLVYDPVPCKGKGRRPNKDSQQKWLSFAWISTLEMDEKSATDIVNAGRSRWNIEESFLRAKHWTNDITHMCSWNMNAIKCHYAMTVIGEIFRIIMEMEQARKHDIKLPFQEINSELQATIKRVKLRDDNFFDMTTWTPRTRSKKTPAA